MTFIETISPNRRNSNPYTEFLSAQKRQAALRLSGTDRNYILSKIKNIQTDLETRFKALKEEITDPFYYKFEASYEKYKNTLAVLAETFKQARALPETAAILEEPRKVLESKKWHAAASALNRGIESALEKLNPAILSLEKLKEDFAFTARKENSIKSSGAYWHTVLKAMITSTLKKYDDVIAEIQCIKQSLEELRDYIDYIANEFKNQS